MKNISMQKLLAIQTVILELLLNMDDKIFTRKYAKRFPAAPARNAEILGVFEELSVQLHKNKPIEAYATYTVYVQGVNGTWLQEQLTHFVSFKPADLESQDAVKERLQSLAKEKLSEVFTASALATLTINQFKLTSFRVPSED